MKKSTTPLKIIAIITILIVLANMLLFAFRMISALTFWIIIILGALIAFPLMNWLKKRK